MTGPKARAALLAREMDGNLARARIGWDGGAPTWRAMGVHLMWGPQIVQACATKTGARFAAWRRRKGYVL